MANPAYYDGSLMKKPRESEPTRKSKRIARESDNHKKLVERWKLIKRAFVLCQIRTNGYTSCMECGAVNPEPIDLDHIIPAGKGGLWVADNAQLLCRKCHTSKHGEPMWSHE